MGSRKCFKKSVAALSWLLFCAASLSPASPGDECWDFRFCRPGVNGTVLAATAWRGHLCIAGAFQTAGSTVVNNVALWDGQNWQALGPGLQADISMECSVRVLATWGDRVFAGGSFTQSGTTLTWGLAQWDGTNWSSVGALGGIIYDMTATSNGLYVAGTLHLEGDTNVYGLARWTGREWETCQSFISHSGQSPSIGRLAVKEPEIYVSGDFESIAGQSIGYGAHWDGSSWQQFGPTNGNFSAIVIHRGELYASASFPWTDNPGLTNLARWDGTNWLPAGPGLDFSCDHLVSDGTNLYALGSFTRSGPILLDNAAKWDGTNWTPLAVSLWQSGEEAYRLAWAEGYGLFALGLFSSVQGKPAGSIAQWNGQEWAGIGPQYALGVQGAISVPYCLASTNEKLFAGGFFSSAGNSAAYSLAVLETNRWASLGLQSNRYARIRALTLAGNNLVAGGDIDVAGGRQVGNLACWNGEQWTDLGGGVNSRIYALATMGSQLMAGGDFTNAGRRNVRFLAAWDGNAWSSLGPNGVDGTVRALSIYSGVLYAGGQFTNAGGMAVNRVACWDGQAWHGMGGGVQGRKAGVYAIAAEGTNVIVGGRFETAGNVPARNVARWDGSSWHSLGQGAENGVAGTVCALAICRGQVFVGGTLTNAGSVPARALAKWNGTNWSALGSGIDLAPYHNPRVYALAADGNSVYVGGMFTSAGNKAASGIARWIAQPSLRLDLADDQPSGWLRLMLRGTAGLRLRPQTSRDLKAWRPVGFFQAVEETLQLDLDGTEDHKFYRCVLEP